VGTIKKKRRSSGSHLLALFQVADFGHELLLVDELEVSSADLGFHIGNSLINLLSGLVGSSLVPDVFSFLDLSGKKEVFYFHSLTYSFLSLSLSFFQRWKNEPWHRELSSNLHTASGDGPSAPCLCESRPGSSFSHQSGSSSWRRQGIQSQRCQCGISGIPAAQGR